MSQPPAAASPLNTRLYNLEYPRSLGVYSTYQEVQAVVDTLADNHFPVERTMIVGTDLKLMERVTGRKTWGKVIGQGVLSGLWMGLFLGLLLMFIAQGDLLVVVTSVLMGIIFFTVWSAVGYAMTGGKRDFTSMVATIPMQYELMVEHTNADQARQILADAGAAPPQPAMPHSAVPGRPGLGGSSPAPGPGGPSPGAPGSGGTAPGPGSNRPTYGKPAPTGPDPAAPTAPTPRPSYGQPAPSGSGQSEPSGSGQSESGQSESGASQPAPPQAGASPYGAPAAPPSPAPPPSAAPSSPAAPGSSPAQPQSTRPSFGRPAEQQPADGSGQQSGAAPGVYGSSGYQYGGAGYQYGSEAGAAPQRPHVGTGEEDRRSPEDPASPDDSR